MRMAYELDFRGRVDRAAKHIASGKHTNRSFDGCFECWDGAAVAVALYRRAKKRPNTSMARNLWRYISRDVVVPEAWKYRRCVDLAALSASMIEEMETKR